MAIQSPESPETNSVGQASPILASYKDPHGFDSEYQRQLRERIILEHVTAILGPITIIKTIPNIPDELDLLMLGPQPPRQSYTPGIVRAHVAPHLRTNNDQALTGVEKYAMRRQQPKEDS